MGGDIILDADGADISLKDGGTSFGKFFKSSSNFIIQSEVQDGDLQLRGNDGGVPVTALSFDMSESGDAAFSRSVDVPGTFKLSGGTNDWTVEVDGSNNLVMKYNGTTVFKLSTAGNLQVADDVESDASL